MTNPLPPEAIQQLKKLQTELQLLSQSFVAALAQAQAGGSLPDEQRQELLARVALQQQAISDWVAESGTLIPPPIRTALVEQVQDLGRQTGLLTERKTDSELGKDAETRIRAAPIRG